MLGGHLFGLYEKALDENDNWIMRLNKVRELGFDFMEISIDESTGRMKRLGDEDEIAKIREAINVSGIGIQSMCLSAHRKYPFGSADPDIRKKAREILKQAVIFADRLGIRVIQLAGYDVYYEPSTAESVRLFKEGMFWAAKEAARYQVMLGMEIMDIELMNSIKKHLVYEQEIRSPWYKAYPDMGNMVAWGIDVLKDLEAGFHSIVGMHVKDTICRQGEKKGVFRDVPFGRGCVDFQSCFKKLEQLGYTGPYLMEMWHKKGEDDRRAVKEARDFILREFEAAGIGGD